MFLKYITTTTIMVATTIMTEVMMVVEIINI
jgi:hypothetical protein